MHSQCKQIKRYPIHVLHNLDKPCVHSNGTVLILFVEFKKELRFILKNVKEIDENCNNNKLILPGRSKCFNVQQRRKLTL